MESMETREKSLVVTWLRELNLWSVGKATVVVLAVLALAQVAASLTGVWLLLVGGLVLAAMMLPLVRWLEELGVPRPLALGGTVVAIFVGLGGAFYTLVPPIIDQTRQLITYMPVNLERLNAWLDSILGAGAPLGGLVDRDQVQAMVSSRAGQLLERTIGLTTAVLGALAGLGIVLTIAVFLLLDRESIMRGVLRFLPTEQRRSAEVLLPRMTRAVGGYLSGVALLAVSVGSATAVGMMLIGVPYPLVLGVAAMLLEIVPYVGPMIAVGLVGLVALTESPWLALWAVLYATALQQLEGYLLAPFILGKTLRMKPFWITLSLVIGATLAGIPGALLALPVAISIGILLDEYDRQHQEAVAAGPPAKPSSPPEGEES